MTLFGRRQPVSKIPHIMSAEHELTRTELIKRPPGGEAASEIPSH